MFGHGDLFLYFGVKYDTSVDFGVRAVSFKTMFVFQRYQGLESLGIMYFGLNMKHLNRRCFGVSFKTVFCG